MAIILVTVIFTRLDGGDRICNIGGFKQRALKYISAKI